MLKVKSLKLITLSFALLLIFTASSLKAVSCDNDPPTVTIVTPEYKQLFFQPTMVLIAADAYDDVAIARVDFYVDGMLIDSDNTYPYRTSKYLSSFGEHTIAVRAIDIHGNSSVANSLIELRRKYGVFPVHN